MCPISLLLKELLMSKGIIVQRLRLTDSIHLLDETGVSSRKIRSLKGECIMLKRRINYDILTPIINSWSEVMHDYSPVRRVTWLCVTFWRHYEMRKNNHAHSTATSVHSTSWQWQLNISRKKHFWSKSKPYELSLTQKWNFDIHAD